MRGKVTLLILILLLSSFSWDWDTHKWIANQVCDYLNCGVCREYILNGSIAPDKDFNDFTNHHCYNTSWNCLASPTNEWACPTRNDCPALEKAQSWLSNKTEGCSYYYNIGVASHYFSDSKVFWHRVQNEDYDNCHAPFETAVGNDIEKADFTVTRCGVTVTKADLNQVVSDLKVYLGAPQDNTQSPDQVQNLLNRDEVKYAIAFFVVLLLTAFSLRKTKRRKR